MYYFYYTLAQNFAKDVYIRKNDYIANVCIF